jgi:hypothetical protein
MAEAAHQVKGHWLSLEQNSGSRTRRLVDAVSAGSHELVGMHKVRRGIAKMIDDLAAVSQYRIERPRRTRPTDQFDLRHGGLPAQHQIDLLEGIVHLPAG